MPTYSAVFWQKPYMEERYLYLLIIFFFFWLYFVFVCVFHHMLWSIHFSCSSKYVFIIWPLFYASVSFLSMILCFFANWVQVFFVLSDQVFDYIEIDKVIWMCWSGNFTLSFKCLLVKKFKSQNFWNFVVKLGQNK